MNILEAQKDMRHGYYGGAPGLLVSGIVWLVAGSIATTGETRRAVIALLIGGMLIHPLAMAVAKLLRRPGAHTKENPLGHLALESTIILLLGIALALGLAQYRVELFFPAMLLVIGGRYLTFQTLYGRRVYWLCGGALAGWGLATAILNISAPATALAGGLIEVLFAVFVFRQAKSEG